MLRKKERRERKKKKEEKKKKKEGKGRAKSLQNAKKKNKRKRELLTKWSEKEGGSVLERDRVTIEFFHESIERQILGGFLIAKEKNFQVWTTTTPPRALQKEIQPTIVVIYEHIYRNCRLFS